MNNDVAFKEMESLIDLIMRSKEQKSRILNLFSYETLDEADTKVERINRDITFQIGGPCVHAYGSILTRAEHTILKEALLEIFSSRIEQSTNKIMTLCADIGKEK